MRSSPRHACDSTRRAESRGDGGVRSRSHFLHEVVAVAVRRGGPVLGRKMWRSLTVSELTTIGLDDRLAEAAGVQLI
jgi:hypothetical protein